MFDFNQALFNKVIKLIDLNTDQSFTEKYEKSVSSDLLDLRNIDIKENKLENFNYSRYIQVFENKEGFIPNLSIIDLLFNEGPNSKTYLTQNY